MQAISRLDRIDDLRDIVEMLCNAAMVVVVTLVAGAVVIAWLCTRRAQPPKAVVVWILLHSAKDESLEQMEEDIIQQMPFHVVYMCLQNIGELHNPGRPLPPAQFAAIKQRATAFATKVQSLTQGPAPTTDLDTITWSIKNTYGQTDIAAYCRDVLRVEPRQGTIKPKHFARVIQCDGLTVVIFKHAMCAFNRAFPTVITRQRRAVAI